MTTSSISRVTDTSALFRRRIFSYSQQLLKALLVHYFPVMTLSDDPHSPFQCDEFDGWSMWYSRDFTMFSNPPHEAIVCAHNSVLHAITYLTYFLKIINSLGDTRATFQFSFMAHEVPNFSKFEAMSYGISKHVTPIRQYRSLKLYLNFTWSGRTVFSTHVCSFNTCTFFTPISRILLCRSLSAKMEGCMNTFIAYSKRLFFVALFSYFIWKVVSSAGTYNREEVNIHIHKIMLISLNYFNDRRTDYCLKWMWEFLKRWLGPPFPWKTPTSY